MIIEENPQRQTIPWRVVSEQNIGDNYAEGPRIRVKCIDPRGLYYNFNRRREGDVFTLVPMYVTIIDDKTGKPVMKNGEVQKKLVTAEQQFSSESMEKVDDSEPIRVTTAQDALNKAQDELNEAKIPRKRA